MPCYYHYKNPQWFKSGYLFYRNFIYQKFKGFSFCLEPVNIKSVWVVFRVNQLQTFNFQLYSFNLNLQFHDSYHPRIGEPRRGGGETHKFKERKGKKKHFTNSTSCRKIGVSFQIRLHWGQVCANMCYVGVVCIHPRLAERWTVWQIVDIDQE